MEPPAVTRGSVLGGALLIGGSCIGAAMLGLPTITGDAGFWPSLLALVVAWGFMVATGLLLLEVNLCLGEGVNVLTMAECTLGKWAKWVASASYLFLFYILLLAMSVGMGSVLSGLLEDHLHVTLAPNYAAWISMAILSVVVYRGAREVDLLNRLMMLGLILCYLPLIIAGAPHVNPELLQESHFWLIPPMLPVMILCFGFHNLVPSMTSYMGPKANRLVLSIVIGSGIAFAVYLVWQWMMLGIIPVSGPHGLAEAKLHGETAVSALRHVTENSQVLLFAEGFSLFAVATTMIGISLGLVDFLADGLRIASPKGKTRLALTCLALLPPLLLSFSSPEIFLEALGLAGGFGCIVLFGVLPALMVWSLRYKLCLPGVRLLPGGKLALVLILLMALAVLGLELGHVMGWIAA